ncbi:MAG: right-handed parallel beta-helix repeat-containing protein [Bacteroidales bacterium]|nr:right-handed parallel beta-helix repeat-containing protein [Bacteroidales bacterium]
MKKLLFLFIAILFSIASYSQTHVPPGPISGTWDTVGSPYLIEGETTVEDGTTLTIEAGVLVEWQGSYTMFIQGQILAIGTETDSIIFTAADPLSGWKSIRFIDTPPGNDTSRFEYCVFEYGKAYGPHPDNSGGALAAVNYSKFIIDHCLFDHNEAMEVNIDIPCGGAICLIASSPLIKNSTFTNNLAISAAAIICYDGSLPLIYNNVFTDNFADGNGLWGHGYGGAIGCYIDSNPQIINNTFSNNLADHGGGAISLVENCNATISYNLIYNNTAGWGGGIEIQDYSSPEITNNTIVNNTADKGGGINIWTGGNPQFRNTILWGNTANVGAQVNFMDNNSSADFYYCNIQDGQAGFGGFPNVGAYIGCIDSIPMFENPLVGNYHLLGNSPCIDAGDSTMFDPDGTRCDIGSYYLDQRDIVALPADDIDYYSFTANWQAATDALGYLLDVALDEDFTIFVEGYENLDVGNLTSYTVEGLEANSNYYYRLRAYYFLGRSDYSNTVGTFTGFQNIDENDARELNKISVFPNPANGISEIRYQISEFRSVSLKVYDITGKQAMVLVNQVQTAGKYKVKLDVADLPDGLYMLRLQAGNESAVGKLLVVH